MFTFQPINFVLIKEVSSKEGQDRKLLSPPRPPIFHTFCLKPQMFPLPYRCAKKKSSMPGFQIIRRRNKRQQEGRKALLYLEWGELRGKGERARCPGRGVGTPFTPVHLSPSAETIQVINAPPTCWGARLQMPP